MNPSPPHTLKDTMEFIPTPKTRQMSRYGGCMRNHAATIGGHAVDGCGEYIPSPTSNPSDVSSFTCAACGCHRNFHLLPHYGDDHFFDATDEEATGSDVLLSPKSLVDGRKNKRHRSKFSKEQKEGMMELAKRIGWSLHRREEGLLVEACRKLGITKKVFKVWMHNHKQAFVAAEPKIADDEAGVPNGNDASGSGEKQAMDHSSSTT